MGNVLTEVLGVDYISAQWQKALAAFKVKEAAFRMSYNDLTTNRQKYYNAGLGKQYDRILNRARAINTSVEPLLKGVRRVYDYLKSGASGLGNPAIVGIPIAAILGTTAIIGAYLILYKGLQASLREYNLRQLPVAERAAARKKLTDADAQAAANESKPFGSGISESVYVIGGIVLLAMFLPKLLKGK